MTAPYPAKYGGAVGGWPVAWRVWRVDDKPDVELSIMSLTVTSSATRAPHITATIVVPWSAAVAAWEPRAATPIQLVLWAAYDIDNHPYAMLIVRDIEQDITSGTITLTAASFDARAIDNAPTPLVTVTGATTLAAVRAAVEAALGTPGIAWDTSSVTVPGPAVTQPDVSDYWDLAQTLIEQMGWRLLPPLTPTAAAWTIRPTPAALPIVPVPASARHTLVTGLGGNITRLTARKSRDTWASRVYMVHEWMTAANVPQRVVGSAGTAGRARVVQHSTPATLAQANAAASAVLFRQAWRGSRVFAEGAPALWLRPDDIVGATIGGTYANYRLDEITHTFPDQLMSLTLREG